MPKNSFVDNQRSLRQGRPTNPPTGGWAVLAAKLIFGAAIIAGLALVNPALFNLSNSGQRSAVSAVTEPQSALALKLSPGPGPSLLVIPSLKISAPFEPLGLQPDHTLGVPKNPMGVGWFIYGARPGKAGAMVVVGHLDSVFGPAIFADLNKIQPGDKIVITNEDGSIIVYQVDSLSKFSQNNFPTQDVYGPLSYPGIRLITCSGIWDQKAGHYSDNLVVFGRKI